MTPANGNKVAKLLEHFEDKGLRRGGILLLRPNIAILFVKECMDVGVRILGIDAFRIGEDFVQPVIEHSVDFTGKKRYHPKMAYGKSLEILEDLLDSELFFEIIYE